MDDQSKEKAREKVQDVMQDNSAVRQMASPLLFHFSSCRGIQILQNKNRKMSFSATKSKCEDDKKRIKLTIPAAISNFKCVLQHSRPLSFVPEVHATCTAVCQRHVIVFIHF